MSPDAIAEKALIEMSRLQRDALIRSCWDRMTLRHLHLLEHLPADEAAAIIESVRRDAKAEEEEFRRAA